MSIELFDSHCHLQHPRYDADREEVIKRTLAAECGMICVGNDWQTSKGAIELASKYDTIWATVGSHPTEDDGHPIEDFRELIKNASRIIAVGEIGLDYYRAPKPEERAEQKEMFLRHFELAKEFSLPLMIHCRDPLRRSEGEASAYDDMLEILKNNPIAGVVHSFTGDFELAQKFLDLGLYLGLNGIITFIYPVKSGKAGAKQFDGASEYDDMVAKVPLGRILIETDAPYLAPVPHRGKRNEPLYVEFVVRRIAEIKKISFEEVVEKTKENTIKLFKLNEAI